MRINTVSHSHLELLLNMGMDLEKYSASALFVPISSPYMECYGVFLFVFCFVLFCFRKSAKASSVISLAKNVLL